MRFLLVHKLDENAPGAFAPSREHMASIGRLMAEMAQAGVLLAAEGVQPSAKGARVRRERKRRTVIDGPFAEAKEVIAGFALIRADSKRDAIEWASRFADLFDDVEVEVREIAEGPPG